MLEALIDARERIASRRATYICWALDDGAVRGYKKAKKLIMKLLGGVVSYNEWLEIHHRNKWWSMSYEEYRIGRLQWLDHLIKHERTRIRRKRNNSAVHFPRRKK
jgi:hypothetical protein